MKAIKLILTAVLFSFHAIGQVKKMPQSGIQFINKDWNTVLAMAKKNHKPVFVDAYTSWCVPCREMKQQVFTNRGIASYFNQHFINFKVDVEKKAGIAFADHYHINSYPTLLFVNGDGMLIKQMEGFMDAKQLTAVAADIH